MKSKESEYVGNNAWFPLMLFCIFLTLKLAGIINWSWWVVTAPLWLPVAIVAGLIVVISITAVIVALLEGSR